MFTTHLFTQLPLVALELMDFFGGDRSHATVVRLLTEELRAVCLTMFVQHIVAPWGGWCGPLHSATPRPCLHRLAARKEMDFMVPTTTLFTNEGTLVEFPQDSQQNRHMFGCIRGMDDDNANDDVNWEVTSKSLAHQAATGS